jgi:invasion protein IalB
LLGAASLVGGVAAQQAPAAKKATPAPAASAGAQNPWVRLCEKIAVGTMYKDGKEVPREANMCVTQTETLDGHTGAAIVTAAVRQMEGEEKQYFMVMVPLNMKLQAGMRAAFYPKDLWERVLKDEKVDESKLKPVGLDYTLCHGRGCTAQVEATPELINDLKTYGGMLVFTIKAHGEPAGFAVPFAGFEQAYTGSPVDARQYAEGRRVMMQQMAQRQREQVEQQKKQQKAAPAPAAPAQK